MKARKYHLFLFGQESFNTSALNGREKRFVFVYVGFYYPFKSYKQTLCKRIGGRMTINRKGNNYGLLGRLG